MKFSVEENWRENIVLHELGCMLLKTLSYLVDASSLVTAFVVG